MHRRRTSRTQSACIITELARRLILYWLKRFTQDGWTQPREIHQQMVSRLTGSVEEAHRIRWFTVQRWRVACRWFVKENRKRLLQVTKAMCVEIWNEHCFCFYFFDRYFALWWVYKINLNIWFVSVSLNCSWCCPAFRILCSARAVFFLWLLWNHLLGFNSHPYIHIHL